MVLPTYFPHFFFLFLFFLIHKTYDWRDKEHIRKNPLFGNYRQSSNKYRKKINCGKALSYTLMKLWMKIMHAKYLPLTPFTAQPANTLLQLIVMRHSKTPQLPSKQQPSWRTNWLTDYWLLQIHSPTRTLVTVWCA